MRWWFRLESRESFFVLINFIINAAAESVLLPCLHASFDSVYPTNPVLLSFYFLNVNINIYDIMPISTNGGESNETERQYRTLYVMVMCFVDGAVSTATVSLCRRNGTNIA